MRSIVTEVSTRDVIFDVYANAAKLGTLTVSRGGIGWFPFNSPVERRVTWERFDQLISTHEG